MTAGTDGTRESHISRFLRKIFTTMNIEINDEYIGELYIMVCDYTKNRGNTFHFIKRSIEERWPEIAERHKPKYDW